MTFTVYKHTNKNNEKSYIGITMQGMKSRWGEHLSDARANRGMCRKFHNAIRKWGEDCWVHETLAEFKDRKDALKFETEMIIKFDSLNNGYNITHGGDRGNYGMKHPPEFGAKISARQRGKNNPMWGKKKTPEQLKKQSESLKEYYRRNGVSHMVGKKHKPESIQKMIESHLGEKNHFYGRKHKPETIKNFSENNPCKGLWGWMNPENRKNPKTMEAYSKANECYQWWIINKRGFDVLCKYLGVKRSNPYGNMIKKFKTGWIPLEDKLWLDEFRK